MTSIADYSLQWPGWPEVWRVLSLRDHNTRVVVIGTMLLGMAAGLIGTFAYLRKRALMGDALSHATLPGVAVAFLLVGGKSLPALLAGAAMTGVLGVLVVVGIRRGSRLKEDAAIGIVLSVFFAFGMVLLSLIQNLGTGNEAGLASFIYGQAAAMIARDAWLIGGAALAVALCIAALFKEFRVVCFDQDFAASQGWPVLAIDLAMMGLVVVTTVIGLQAVGLILVVALLIIPPAAARFWTDDLVKMIALAGTIGAVSGWLGASASALTPRMPTGAIIVITAGVIFTLSMLAAPHRGVLAAVVRRWRLSRRVAFQHLLRALAEFEERAGADATAPFDAVLAKRSWSAVRLRALVRQAARLGLLRRNTLPALQLTTTGRAAAQKLLRNHRLWEAYLIKYADIAPSHVDRDADEVEHVLGDDVVERLEAILKAEGEIPPSPHDEAEGSMRAAFP